jgi:hypothetical protein
LIAALRGRADATTTKNTPTRVAKLLFILGTSYLQVYNSLNYSSIVLPRRGEFKREGQKLQTCGLSFLCARYVQTKTKDLEEPQAFTKP